MRNVIIKVRFIWGGIWVQGYLLELCEGMLLLGKKAVYNQSAESEILTQLNLSITLADIVMVGAALSRESIAHECAPAAMSNMFDEKV